MEEHKCPQCNEPLIISSSKFEVKNDDNPETPTELFSVLTMVCINSRIDPIKKTVLCPNYCGTDLNNPLTIVETIRNPVALGG